MDRREALGMLGLAGVVLGAPPVRGGDPDHGHQAAEGPMAPVAGFHLHFCGIHLAKEDPKLQLIVQHYCGPCGDLHQCLLFDSSKRSAKLIGVEYIIPDARYRELPDAEKRYWHPHTYEVLIAPGMKPDDELKFMKAILTTWGKTWHTWPDPSTAVPIGEPMLMWAVTGDGQLDEEVLAARDKEFGVEAAQIRESRGQAIGYAVPQVPFPKSRDDVGRQWTDKGADKPTPRM